MADDLNQAISDVAKEISNSTEISAETADSATDITTLSDKLRGLVSRFHVARS